MMPVVYLAPTPIKSVSNPVFDEQNEYTDFDEGANADAAVAAVAAFFC